MFVGQGLPKLVNTEVLKYPSDVKYPTVIQAEPYCDESDSKLEGDHDDIMGAL